MSALHVYVICCDAPSCTARFTRDLARADRTRQEAQADGWVHGVMPPDVRRGGLARFLDYCPVHVELGTDLRVIRAICLDWDSLTPEAQRAAVEAYKREIKA